MLISIDFFIQRASIRSSLFLFSPIILQEDDIQIPRQSVIHLLDPQYNNHFPSRDLVYFRSIPKNKKIPIQHLIDLNYKEETLSLQNKKVSQELRDWSRQNVKSFIQTDLLDSKNNQPLISVYNYNLLKDLYNYRTSMFTSYYKYRNLYLTYWETIHKAIKVDQTTRHFVKINLPSSIPSPNIINMILKFSPSKYSRIVNDPKLLQVFDLYKWLTSSTRESSTMASITDEDSQQLIIELNYKGYVVFLPLYVLRSLSAESTLDNASKLPESKLQRLFVISLNKIQNKINAELEKNETKDTNLEASPEDESAMIQDSEEETLDEDTSREIEGSDLDVERSEQEVNQLLNSKKLKDLDINNITDLPDISKLIDSELSSLDTEATDEIYEESILKLSEDTEETPTALTINYDETYIESLLQGKTLQSEFDNFLKEVSTLKLFTSQEIRSLKKIYQNRLQLTSPYNTEEQIDTYTETPLIDKEINKNDIKIKMNHPAVSDDMKENVVQHFDKKYLSKVIKKDIVSSILNLEKAKIIIKNYEVEEQRSALGNYEIHKLTLKPFNGKESTVYFRLPIINSEGEFVAAGIRYKMRKNRQDVPIRKISPTKVSLTSNYGKLFVLKTERKAFNEITFLNDYIKNSYINEEGIIKHIIPGSPYSNYEQYPNHFAILSMNFKSIETDQFMFMFDTSETLNYIKPEIKNQLDSEKLIFVGYGKNSDVLVMDYQNQIYNYSKQKELLGDIYTLLQIPNDKVPSPFSVLNVLGDPIPLGVILSYYLGLSNLISVTKTKYTLLEPRKQYQPARNELVLKFSDYKLVLEPSDEHRLLFNGFLFFKDFIKEHELKDFDYKEIYLNIFEFRNFSLLHIKELNSLEELFLDPITVDVLTQMNEPTDYFKVLLRANQLLSDFSHPDINDPEYSRIRGYDRVPGLMYRALAESIRAYKFKNNNRSKIELDPYKVWNYVTQDNTVKITEDNNPINDIKEFEAVTLTGLDGLNKDAMPVLLRRFHKNDMGLVSEATVDSGDVAINSYLTPYAKLKSIRGTVDINDQSSQENSSKLFSTSALLAPYCSHDD